MTDNVNALRFGDITKNLKGHAKLELFDARSGELVQKVEQDNMVTNAVSYLAPILAGAKEIQRYSTNYHSMVESSLMPLATNALGGLMLFDDVLTEDKDNIKFPMNQAHFVACCGRGTNTSNPRRGSLNSAETIRTSNGYKSVWDFSTSQANGTITSLALSNKDGANPFYPVIGYSMHNLINTSGNDDDFVTLYEDEKTGYTYFATFSNTSYNGSELTVTMTIWKEYVPLYKYKVADSVGMRDYPEQVTSKTFTIPAHWLAHFDYTWQFNKANDGYLYLIGSTENQSGDATVKYIRIKCDDLSWDVSDVVTLSLADTHLKQQAGVVANGYAYFGSYDSKSIYQVNLSNPVDIKQFAVPSEYWLENRTYRGGVYVGNSPIYWDELCFYNTIEPRYNGGIRVYLTMNDTASGHYKFYSAFLYEDGTWIVDGLPYRSDTSFDYAGYQPVRFENKNLLCRNWAYTKRGLGYIRSGYLGTICNLATPIVKNASQTLKVTYTLTDTEE